MSDTSIDLNDLSLFSQDDTAQQINHLHAEAHAHAETAVKRAIQCGMMLAEKKAHSVHGAWLPWVEKHLTFDVRTAQRYLQIAENTTRVSHLDSVREAVKLLAAPKEEKEEEAEFRNDPELERRVTIAERRSGELTKTLADLDEKLKQARARAVELEHLQADKAKIANTLKDIHELEKRKQELFKDSESLRVATQVLVRSREFFTRECMQVAALKFRPGTVEAISQDMAGLIELVENWTVAMRAKFMEDV